MSQLSTIIEQAFEDRANYSATDCPTEIRQAVEEALTGLDNGTLRVAEKIDGEWVVHQWLKKAVLLSFKLNDNQPIEACDLQFYDKVATKYSGWTEEQFKAAGVRVVPPAVARRGSFQAKNVVLMPSYVNIGAYVDEGTMVDTWATVGSCAQIGKNVHLSGGVGIGGVLEPLQASPVIIEDGCFIGSRCIVVEGVIVEKETYELERNAQGKFELEVAVRGDHRDEAIYFIYVYGKSGFYAMKIDFQTLLTKY